MFFAPRKPNRLAIQHLMSHPTSALFAGMGLGKTVSTLSAFYYLRLLGEARRMLVVAPLRVILLTWPNELQKWDHLRGLKMVSLRTKEGWRALLSGSADVYLVNWEMLPKLKRRYVSKTRTLAFDTVVFDELTAAANHNSKRVNCIRQALVPKRGVLRKWGLTGTPVPNHLMQIFAQIRLLDGGKRLGPQFGLFRETYFHATDYMQYHWEPNDGAREKIFGRLADIVLSLPASVYSDVSAPVMENVEVSLPDKVSKLYETFSRQLIATMGKKQEVVVASSAGVLVNKLLQMTGGCIYTEDKETINLHSVKLDALRVLRKAHPREPLLVACNFIHERKRILRAFPEARGFQDDPEFLAKWNQGRIPMLVVNPQSVGHGLNMQFGGRVLVWYSLTYSRERYDQLVARLVRHGQEEVVRVYHIVCRGTIDEAVLETLHARGENQTTLLQTLHNFRTLYASLHHSS